MLEPLALDRRLGDLAPMPDPEVPERPARRCFSAEYKLRIVEEANAATEAGRGRRSPPPRRPLQQPPHRLPSAVPGRRPVEPRPHPLAAENEGPRRPPQSGAVIAMGSEGEFYALSDRERAERDSAIQKTRRRPPTHG